jgi:hypothetical protein
MSMENPISKEEREAFEKQEALRAKMLKETEDEINGVNRKAAFQESRESIGNILTMQAQAEHDAEMLKRKQAADAEKAEKLRTDLHNGEAA